MCNVCKMASIQVTLAAMGRVTIKDVARAAGVSASAVSRVFTEGASASADTRSKVLAAAETLGYRPNALARGLVGDRTNLIALVIGRTRNIFDSLFLDTLAESLARRRQRLLVSPVQGNESADEGLMSALDYQADAVVVAAGTAPLEISERCTRLGVPILLMGRVIEDAGVDCILGDNRDGARQAAELLVATGCTRIAYLGRGHGVFSDGERRQGLTEALTAQGLDLADEAMVNMEEDHGFAAAVALLSRRHRPDAVFCGNDIIAFGVIEAAQALGITIPDELSVVGFDNLPMADWPSYRLTTVDYPITATVEAVVERLERRLATPRLPPAVQRIPTRLVVRETTRRA